MPVARRITLRRKKRNATDLFEEEFALESLKSVNEDNRNAMPMGEVQVRGREQAIQVYQVA
jgi:hypothetical protein